MKKQEKCTRELLAFIEQSPTAYHAADNLKKMAESAGYEVLSEQEEWNLKPGGRYVVLRNGSSVAAFAVPEGEFKGFHMVAAHSDSPTYKVKENAEMKVEEQYIKLNTERYGGMLPNTWLDRPLSVAGRVAVKTGNGIAERLVKVDQDLLVIPNVAIHMNREGTDYNAQIDMLPLYGQADGKLHFADTVAKAAKVKKDEILAYDLFLYVREQGRVFGGNGEFILAPRLDDLQCAFSAMKAMTATQPKEYLNICVIFDNEEVGSGTRQGADSTFLSDLLERIREAFGKSNAWLQQKIAGSLLISADNAHAVHPNHPEKADPTNRPYLNGGIVIKYHGSQRYTTDAMTAAAMKELCREAGVPVQTYTNRSDIAGGSTLGNISTAHVSVPSVDIGLPQLAMHSAVETAGVKDTSYAVEMMTVFFGK